jgi:hypothetical protein
VPALKAFKPHEPSALAKKLTHHVNDPVSNVYTTNESMMSFILKESGEAQSVENIK